MKKVLWFSRHVMTQEQLFALQEKLGAVEITQVSGTIQNVHVGFEAQVNGSEAAEQLPPFKELLLEYDIVAIVAPIQLQQQILSVAGNRPVIFAQNKRTRQEGGEFKFEFEGWQQLLEVKVVTQPFA